MASRLFSPNPFKSLDNDLVVLFSLVTFGATSTITSQDGNGVVVSALGTGTFDVQLGTAAARDRYPTLFGVFFSPLAAAAGDTGWQIIEQTVAADGTFSIRNAPGGVATAPVTGTSVYLMIVCRNSGTPRKGT